MTTEKLTTWQARLDASRRELLTLLEGLTPDQWQAPAFSDGDTWTVTTVVAHLAENERGMSIHVHKIRKGEETIPPDFDLTRWNAGVKQRSGDPTPAELFALLANTRTRVLDVMASLKAEDWARTGRHPSRGLITIEQYYETMSDHERTHAQDIRTALGLNTAG